LLTPTVGLAQKYSYKKKFGTQKNTVYFYWGYNRSAFTKSNINFHGPNYDFTAYSVKAHDRPAKRFSQYVYPDSLTIPQFNIRIGWYYKFRWDVSIGYDHMKYVMAGGQNLSLNGVIEGTSGSLNGTYTDADGFVPINNSELHYENTNGLNYISVQLNNTAPLYKTKNLKFAIQRRLGGGLGPVITQTDFHWDGTRYSTNLKFAGYGISLHSGLRFDFFNRFFFQTNGSAGFIHLPKNFTRLGNQHYAKHKFVFAQWELLGGVLFYLRTKNACDTCPDWH
jgi:hypothetical protein